MSCNCCWFIQPDTAISRNRNGSRDFVMKKVTLSPAVHGPLDNPLQIYADRFSRHYGVGSPGSEKEPHSKLRLERQADLSIVTVVKPAGQLQAHEGWAVGVRTGSRDGSIRIDPRSVDRVRVRGRGADDYVIPVEQV